MTSTLNHRRKATRSHLMRAAERGMSLIEIMVVIAIVAVITGGMVVGVGAIGSARLKDATTLISGGVRVAYSRANATSKATRLAFDFEKGTVQLQETAGNFLVKKGSITGGAQAANELEAEALAAAEEATAGPKAPKAQFVGVRALAFGEEARKGDGPGLKTLPGGVKFRQVEVAHEDGPITEGMVYLYFWPGGQTERAAIQLYRPKNDTKTLTVLVAPLTGKVTIVGGAVEMARPRGDEELSERDDNG